MTLVAVAATRSSHRPPLCGHAFRYTSALIRIRDTSVRIRDTSGKTRSQNERIAKGQADGHFAASVQLTAHMRCPLSGPKSSFANQSPTVCLTTLRIVLGATPTLRGRDRRRNRLVARKRRSCGLREILITDVAGSTATQQIFGSFGRNRGIYGALLTYWTTCETEEGQA